MKNLLKTLKAKRRNLVHESAKIHWLDPHGRDRLDYEIRMIDALIDCLERSK